MDSIEDRLTGMIEAAQLMEMLVKDSPTSLDVNVSWTWVVMDRSGRKSVTLDISCDTNKIIEMLNEALLKSIAGLERHIVDFRTCEDERAKDELYRSHQKRREILEKARATWA